MAGIEGNAVLIPYRGRKTLLCARWRLLGWAGRERGGAEGRVRGWFSWGCRGGLGGEEKVAARTKMSCEAIGSGQWEMGRGGGGAGGGGRFGCSVASIAGPA